MIENISNEGNAAEEGPINPLRVIPFTQKTFQGISGTTYYVEHALSIARYKHFQKMELELGFGLKFSEIAEKLTNMYNLANLGKMADIGVVVHGMLEGATFIGEKKPIALYVATLFINRSEEDRTVWNETLVAEKLKDWEDIDVNFFLALALSRVQSFDKVWIQLTEMLDNLDRQRRRETEEDTNLFPNE